MCGLPAYRDSSVRHPVRVVWCQQAGEGQDKVGLLLSAVFAGIFSCHALVFGATMPRLMILATGAFTQSPAQGQALWGFSGKARSPW